MLLHIGAVELANQFVEVIALNRVKISISAVSSFRKTLSQNTVEFVFKLLGCSLQLRVPKLVIAQSCTATVAWHRCDL